jgi:ABC-type polar amino acid transport system ATPase subunit
VENVRAFLEVNELSHIIDFIYSGRSLFGKEKIIRKMLLREQIDAGRVVYAGDEPVISKHVRLQEFRLLPSPGD